MTAAKTIPWIVTHHVWETNHLDAIVVGSRWTRSLFETVHGRQVIENITVRALGSGNLLFECDVWMF